MVQLCNVSASIREVKAMCDLFHSHSVVHNGHVTGIVYPSLIVFNGLQQSTNLPEMCLRHESPHAS